MMKIGDIALLQENALKFKVKEMKIFSRIAKFIYVTVYMTFNTVVLASQKFKYPVLINHSATFIPLVINSSPQSPHILNSDVRPLGLKYIFI